MDRRTMVASIAEATRRALADLLSTGEHPYLLLLVTTGEGHAPFLAACTHEAQARALARDPEYAEWTRWSYADSEHAIVGLEHFAEVRAQFDRLVGIDAVGDAEEWVEELDFRLDLMERALRLLDRGGEFGTGAERAAVLVNAEVVPPDAGNTARALRLNDAANPVLLAWLDEAAEPPEA